MAPRLPDVEEIAPLIRGRVSLDALKNAGILPLRDDGERLVVALASPESREISFRPSALAWM